jgi:hypothetical protein
LHEVTTFREAIVSKIAHPAGAVVAADEVGDHAANSAAIRKRPGVLVRRTRREVDRWRVTSVLLTEVEARKAPSAGRFRRPTVVGRATGSSRKPGARYPVCSTR